MKCVLFERIIYACKSKGRVMNKIEIVRKKSLKHLKCHFYDLDNLSYKSTKMTIFYTFFKVTISCFFLLLVFYQHFDFISHNRRGRDVKLGIDV